MRLTAVVVGCGRVGSQYDEERHSGASRSHAGAYAAVDDVELIGGVDPRPERRAAFSRRWGVPAHASVAELVAKARPDLWSICAPPEAHLDLVRAAVGHGARAIWCEKPLAPTVHDAQALRAAAERSGVPLAVSYLRRWDPAHQRVAQSLREGRLGRVQHVVVHYCRGLRNYGTHAIDLLRWFVGEPSWVWATEGRDRDAQDPSPAVMLGFADEAIAALLPVERAAYDLFEVHVYGSGGRVSLTRGGQRIQTVEFDADLEWGEPRVLADAGGRTEAGMTDPMRPVVENLVAAVREGAPLSCTAEDGLAALRIAEAVDRVAVTGARTALVQSLT